MQKKTGIYLVQRYDHYGAKLETLTASSYLEGLSYARTHTDEYPEGSAVVLRVLYNTKDKYAGLT